MGVAVCRERVGSPGGWERGFGFDGEGEEVAEARVAEGRGVD
jgi:hypothetical protein